MITLIRSSLVAPIGSLNNEPTPPIALAYLAGALKHHGFEVKGIDATGEALYQIRRIEGTKLQYNGLRPEEIVDKINPKTKIIGISSTFSHEWILVKNLIAKIRDRFPSVTIIGGGEHFTSLPKYSLEDCRELDFVGLGEGEETLVEFCSHIENGKTAKNIDGICYLSGNDFVKTGERKRIQDIDRIPWPAWEFFPLETYLKNSISFGASFGRNMPMMLSRGCPYRCTFCSNPSMWTTKYSLRSVEDVIKELNFYIKNFDISGVQFYDLTAVVKKKWIVEFCRKLVSHDIKIEWSLPSGTRSEALDLEAVQWLARANLKYLVYAPESASEKTLKLIKKQISFPKMVDSIKGAIKEGIAIRTNFIIGFPHETIRDIVQTLKGQLKLSLLGVDEAPIFPFQPYPGTEIFYNLVKQNKIKINDNYSNYTKERVKLSQY